MARKDKTAEVEKVKFLEVKVSGEKLAFVFADKGRLEFDPKRCSAEILQQATLHGFNQKIRDSAAGYSKGNDFAGAREEMSKVIESLYNGSWNRQGGGVGAGVVMADIAYAISKIKNVAVERAMKAVEQASEDQRKEWAKNPKVAALMAESKAARLAKAAQEAEDFDIDLGDGETD